jgi:tartrate/fumarate subfamily iron-sulfur-dependent hydro-lyase alpha chain
VIEFDYRIVEEAAKELYIRALKFLPPDVTAALEKAHARETNETAKGILRTILRNIEIARNEQLLICQDTGLPIFFVKDGSHFPVDGADVAAALEKGVKAATFSHPFRGSSTHPLSRTNPQTSVGKGLPVIHWEFEKQSDLLEILMIPKSDR